MKIIISIIVLCVATAGAQVFYTPGTNGSTAALTTAADRLLVNGVAVKTIITNGIVYNPIPLTNTTTTAHLRWTNNIGAGDYIIQSRICWDGSGASLIVSNQTSQFFARIGADNVTGYANSTHGQIVVPANMGDRLDLWLTAGNSCNSWITNNWLILRQ